MTGLRVDPITAEVVGHHLLATAEEMGAALIRAAFSPDIKERADCSTALFDREGQVIAQAHRVPLHLGSMIGAIAGLRRRFPLEAIRPGDMFAANDPHHGGGSHLPDITVVAPFFHADRVVAFAASIAHHSDVGGMVAGSISPVATELFQEGLRIPAVRIMRDGQINYDVFDLILLNSRVPEERIGDLRAQFAANHVGLRGMAALFARYGEATAEAAIATYLDHTERRMRAAIARLAPGVYRAEDFITGNFEGELAPIRLTLTVEGESLRFDFAGSAPQLRAARNMPFQAVSATVYAMTKAMLDPDVPANAGCYRPIAIETPPGTIVGPAPTAACGARASSAAVLGDVVGAVLSEAMPDNAIARCGPHQSLVLSGTDPRTGAFFVDHETLAGGLGARARRDGLDGVRVPVSGASNLPVEVLEHAYPLRVETYALREGSGGAGRQRGGMGIVRDYRILGDDTVLAMSSARQHMPAQGLFGGRPGAVGQFVQDPGTPNETVLPSALGRHHLPKGSVLRVCTPAGGGYGPPGERDPAAVARDLAERRISAKEAAADCGRPPGGAGDV
jgi:N-methylhydantoinase B